MKALVALAARMYATSICLFQPQRRGNADGPRLQSSDLNVDPNFPQVLKNTRALCECITSLALNSLKSAIQVSR